MPLRDFEILRNPNGRGEEGDRRRVREVYPTTQSFPICCALQHPNPLVKPSLYIRTASVLFQRLQLADANPRSLISGGSIRTSADAQTNTPIVLNGLQGVSQFTRLGLDFTQ